MTSTDSSISDVEKLPKMITLPRRIALLILLCLVLLPGINHGIWRPDEPRVAGICAEMARTGDYCVPHLNGRPFLEKPPLYFACGALAGRLFGADKDVPYRVVSILFAVLTLILTFLIASKRDGPVTGILAACILASSWQFFHIARWIQVDIALVFGVTLAMYAYLKLVDKNKLMDSVILGLALGIAFMAKGLVGPVIVAAAVCTDLIRTKDISLILQSRPFPILLFMLVPVLPWLCGLYIRGGWPFVREVIVVNNIMRFLGTSEAVALGHQHGILYYFNHFPRDFLPWTFMFIPALVYSIRNFRDDRFISWFIGPFVLLCLASTKRGVYLVPLYPAAACMIAQWLSRGSLKRWEANLQNLTWIIAILGSALPLAGIFLGRPVLGIIMAFISLGFAICALKNKLLKEAKGLALVLVMCVALSSSMTIYFSYMKPKEDYLGFTRQVLEQAGTRQISILGSEEIFEGVLPLLSGRNFPVVDNPADINEPGLYVWADRHNKVLKQLKKAGRINVILEKDIGNKQARLAQIIPEIKSSCFPDGSTEKINETKYLMSGKRVAFGGKPYY